MDYLFAQVGVGQRSVDTSPNCGNMLAGVGPFAIEQGLVPAADGTTTVRVYNVNTRSRIDVAVQTPGRRVTYAGDARIDGVAGTAAPIRLNFLDAWGAVTGSVFPTGQRIDVIDGVEVTCLDAAMPLMIVRARDLGVTGRETPDQLDADTALLERLESLRRTAGGLMGLGDVSDKVIPKPVIVSAGDDPHSITSRYFTPRRCHTSHAATGAIGVATAFALPGTVACDAAATRTATAPGGRPARTTSPCCTPRAASTCRSSSGVPTGRSSSRRRRWCAPPARSCRAISTCPTTSSPPPDPAAAPTGPPTAAARPFPRGPSRSSCRPRPAAPTTRSPAPSPDGSARASARPSPSTTAPAPTVRSPASTWPEPGPTGTPCCSATSPPTR